MNKKGDVILLKLPVFYFFYYAEYQYSSNERVLVWTIT